MKSQNKLHFWKSGIIQAIKWTTMSFDCLMTFSLGIFLGKKWSETDIHTVNETSMQLGSNPKDTSSEHKKVEDIQLKEIASEKAETKNDVTTTTHSSERNPSSNFEKKQDNRNEKEAEKNELEPSETTKIENSSFYNNLPSGVTATLSAKYTIQLGTYNKEKEAMSYLQHLKDQGVDAFYMSFTNDNNQIHYKVSSGVYSDKTLANNELQRILKTTSIEEASVQEIF